MNDKNINNPADLQAILDEAVTLARVNGDGNVTAYIPELAQESPDLTSLAVSLPDGSHLRAGDEPEHHITLQSVAKVVLLIGLLEEFGANKVFSWVRVEPSGTDFASIARLDQFGPLPSNPMLNSGAILLCSKIPGNSEQKISWLDDWMEKLFGEKIAVNAKVLASERRTGDRNRSIAYLLKSNKMFEESVDEVLETYFSLCSFEVTIEQAAYFPMLLANKGKTPNGEQIITEATVQQVLSIMATCGMYNESGAHLVRTGMPAKSGVSGLIVACVPGKAGIATYCPRVNRKGTSIRGELMLQHLSKALGWHFV